MESLLKDSTNQWGLWTQPGKRILVQTGLSQCIVTSLKVKKPLYYKQKNSVQNSPLYTVRFHCSFTTAYCKRLNFGKTLV